MKWLFPVLVAAATPGLAEPVCIEGPANEAYGAMELCVPSELSADYTAANLLDNDPATAWCAAEEGAGLIRMTFADLKGDPIAHIVNGNAADPETHAAFGAIKRVTGTDVRLVSWDPRNESDTTGYIYLTDDMRQELAYVQETPDIYHTAGELRLEWDNVRPGTEVAQPCLSELRLTWELDE